MWLSKPRGQEVAGEAQAESGPVTLLGPEPAVYLAGERRNVALCHPGGLTWRPKVGQQVLVLKAGQNREIPYVLGVDEPAEDEELAPGEVCLGGDGGRVRCGQGVEITGAVTVNGESLEALIRRIATPPAPPVVGG